MPVTEVWEASTHSLMGLPENGTRSDCVVGVLLENDITIQRNMPMESAVMIMGVLYVASGRRVAGLLRGLLMPLMYWGVCGELFSLGNG